ncbi:MAG: tetratricopeptide repeat protein [Tannerellaceae bacterium]|jgi:tetratricopeptide (TPR) repeat protein|nr:tetratricopeptide repeat protein [Tannerellaceae bacterium]
METMKYVVWIFGCLLFLPGCKNGQREEALLPGLIQAEAMMWDEPESALAVLDTIKIPVRDTYQYAIRCLLYTQAQNRNNISYTSDSLIRVAVRYFESRDDIHRKAMTWFYAGRVYADLRQTVEAATFYIKARDAASQTTDHRLQYLICLNYGWLCLNQMALDQAKGLLNEAYIHAQASGVEKYCVTALDYIGRYYAFNQQMDSAVVLLEQAVELGKQMNDSTSLITVLNDAAITLYMTGKYDQAISYLYESVSLEQAKNTGDIYSAYHNLGDSYRLIGKTDSAVHYLNKALGSENPELLQSCYFSLAEVNRDLSQWEEAVYYTELFWQYTDSIAQSAHHKEITELHARSEYQQAENRNSRLRIEKANLLKAGFISITCILIITLALIYIFQRKLLRAEHIRLSMQNRLREQIRVHQANEQEINRTNELIHSITTQLAQRPLLEEQQKEQNDLLQIAYDYNNRLRRDNQQLDRKISACRQSLQEKKINQATHDRLVEQHTLWRNRVEMLQEKLLRRMKLTGQLKKRPKFLSKEQIQMLYDEVNMIYPSFGNRLRNQYTHLSDVDILTCCLIKLRFSTSEIAVMTGVAAASVTKRKRRMKENMQKDRPDIWKNEPSLDTYLWWYGM